MRNSGNTVVCNRSTQRLFRHFLVRHGLDHVRSGNEHVRRVFNHDVEVSDGRTVDSAPRAWSHDATDRGTTPLASVFRRKCPHSRQD